MTPRTTGLLLLVLTAVGWGSNWPMLKVLLGEMPPMTARGAAGVAGGLMLAALAPFFAQRLAVARPLWPRLTLFSALNVSAWMGFATLGLLWLNASEAAILAYTAPLWTAIAAWPVLGERPTARRVAALALGFGGVAVLFAGRGLEFGIEKAPGMGFVLLAGLLFGIGTALSKRLPLPLAPIPSAAWQVGLGCAPLLLLGLVFERMDWPALSGMGWFFLIWMAVVPLGLAYLTWFEALRRVPATVAAMGTMIAPMVGVLGAAIFLGEPFGLREAAALLLTLAGVALAARA